MNIAHDDLFSSLMAAVLPRGGCVVTLSEVYFDESGTHDGSPIMTVAGYLFRNAQARRFSREWQKSLSEFGMPFAHMTDCANGNAHYKSMSMEARILSGKRLIEAIKRRTALGFSVSLDPQRFASVVSSKYPQISAYSFCLLTCMSHIRHWADDTRYEGKIAYFFESGHRHAAEADAYIRQSILAFPERIREARYVSHSFVDKAYALPLQAADMLAWQHQHYLRRRSEGHTQKRADFSALLRPQDRLRDYTDARLEQFVEIIEAGSAASDLGA